MHRIKRIKQVETPWTWDISKSNICVLGMPEWEEREYENRRNIWNNKGQNIS